MIYKKVDFIAHLNFRTTEQGGRKTPVFSNYRPQVKFPFSEMQTSGEQTFLDKETVNPGDSVDAEIKLLSPEFFEHQLYEGLQFEFREASRIIGTGIIIRVINLKLQKASA